MADGQPSARTGTTADVWRGGPFLYQVQSVPTSKFGVYGDMHEPGQTLGNGHSIVNIRSEVISDKVSTTGSHIP